MPNQIRHLNSAFSNIQLLLTENYRITAPTSYKEKGGCVCLLQREEVFFFENPFHLKLLSQLCYASRAAQQRQEEKQHNFTSLPGCPPSQLSERVTKKSSPGAAAGADLLLSKKGQWCSLQDRHHDFCSFPVCSGYIAKHPQASLKIYMAAPRCTGDCLPDTTGTGSCYQLMRLQHQSIGWWVYAGGKTLSFHPQIHTPNGAAEPESVKFLHINIFLRKLVTRLEEYFQ